MYISLNLNFVIPNLKPSNIVFARTLILMLHSHEQFLAFSNPILPKKTPAWMIVTRGTVRPQA